MKSKIFTLILSFTALISIKVMAQQPKYWTESLYNEDLTSVIETEKTLFSEGSTSLKYTFTDDGVPYFICDTFAVTADANFTFDFDFYVPDNKTEVTTRIFFFQDDGTQITKLTSSGVTDNPSWQTITQTGTVPTDATKAYVVIRTLTGAGWDGSATFYADNASYTEDGGTNQIMNPGFEEWEAPVIEDGSTVDRWTESLYTEELTSVIVPEQTTVSEGFTSLKYTFTDDGVPYFICDTFAVTADANFTFDFDFYVPDDKSEITTRIFFFQEDGTQITKLTSSGVTDNPSWQTITQTGTVPTDATKAYVVIRMLTGAGWDGSATFYADNASYTEDGGPNKIINKGFETWSVSASDEKDIITFRFEGLTPAANGTVSLEDHTVSIEVPYETDLTALVPTIAISDNATISPESGVAQDFSSPVTYTVTAEDESTQDWVVTVTKAPEGQTILFSEDFEDINVIPSDWVIIDADGYPQAESQQDWADSAWIVTTSSREELAGTKVAMASSFVTMDIDKNVYDWLILPSITLGDNSVLSWQAMSVTSTGNYPDDYFVAIAPAVDGVTPSVSYFETDGVKLLEVEPESWSKGVSNPGDGLASHSVNLADTGYADMDVWIAFVCNTDRYTNPETGEPNATAGGSELAIDNIKVVNEATSTGINIVDKNDFDVTIFPNPTSGSFKLNLESDVHSMANIEIIDLTGRTVYSKHHEINVGKNYIDVHANELNNGIYLVRTTYNNKGNVSKLMIR